MVDLVVGKLVVVLGSDVVALDVAVLVIDNVGVVVGCDVDVLTVVILVVCMLLVVLGCLSDFAPRWGVPEVRPGYALKKSC